MGYVKGSNKLKLITLSDGGILDLEEDLNDGKILFFLLHHSKTFENGKAPKLVLVNWCGDGVPGEQQCCGESRGGCPH